MDPAPSTVVDLLRRRAGDDGLGLVAGTGPDGRSWTWREVVAAAEDRAAALVARRRPGPFHVGVLLDNTPDYLFTLFGSALAGATLVGLNPTRRGDELARDVRHTDCQLVLTDATHEPLLAGLDLADAVVTSVADLAADPSAPGEGVVAHRSAPGAGGDPGEGGPARAPSPPRPAAMATAVDPGDHGRGTGATGSSTPGAAGGGPAEAGSGTCAQAPGKGDVDDTAPSGSAGPAGPREVSTPAGGDADWAASATGSGGEQGTGGGVGGLGRAGAGTGGAGEAGDQAPGGGEGRGVGADHTFVLMFTSGSTGAPKAVRMTHGRAVRAGVAATWFGPDDVLYCAMPLFHGNALNAVVLPALATGAAIALRDRFSASGFMPDVRRHGATFFTMVGRALAHVLATPPRPDDRDHKVKFALAPESSPTDVRAFRKRFGIHCVTGYGSSENAVVLVPVPGMPKDAMGRPQEGIDAAVVDPRTGEERPRARFDAGGRLVNADEAVGEIVGRNVVDRFEGYYHNPEAEAERTRGGWYWTGDLGYVDADGLFYFAGRVGEWLRVDAENFATAPVERVLGRFPGTSGVVVYPVPDERTADDQVMAAIEMAGGVAFDPGAFAAFLAEQPDLGTKWAPRYVRVTRLPVGPTGKVDKRSLQAERWTTADPVWWRPDRTGGYRRFTPADRTELEARFRQHGRSPDRR